MIPNTRDRALESSGVVASGMFGISLDDSAHIMTILRDTLYSDKVLAVLREYSANAWDSHRDSGKPELPIKVTLPTAMDPTLYIRDFGSGLSQEDVFRLYTQYGASTKRNNDNAVGMLGIGSKSGFAYSDSFTVTSFFGGMKKTYVAVLDASEKGLISLLHEEPCDETGIQIQIAVRPHDINEFERKAKALFKYFNPRPAINTTIPELPPTQKKLAHGIIYDGESGHEGWVAVMGCVSYRINLEQLEGLDGNPDEGVADFLSDIAGALYFNIGDLHIAASREELKYSDSTKKKLVEKFNALVEEFVQDTLQAINTAGLTPWERRVRAQVLVRLRLPVPKDCKDIVRGYVDFPEFPKSFTIEKNRKRAGTLGVAEENRLLLRNDTRSLLGFGLTEHDYIVRQVEKAPWDTIQSDLTEYIKARGLEGIPILKTSEMEWNPPRKDYTGRTINIKHKLRVFRLNPKEDFRRPYSKCWDGEDRVPTEQDVFVIISNFRTVGFDIFRDYSEDEKLMKAFGLEMPTLYGYKTTEKAKVEVSTCIGIHYPDWRAGIVKMLLTPEVQAEIDEWEWSNTKLNHYYYDSKPDKQIEKTLEKGLGKTHPITEFVQKHNLAKAAVKKNGTDQKLQLLRRRMDPAQWVSTVEAAKRAIFDKYPLLELNDRTMSVLWGDHGPHWIQYIRCIDK